MFATYMLTDLSCDSCTQLRPNYDEEEEEDEEEKKEEEEEEDVICFSRTKIH